MSFHRLLTKDSWVRLHHAGNPCEDKRIGTFLHDVAMVILLGDNFQDKL